MQEGLIITACPDERNRHVTTNEPTEPTNEELACYLVDWADQMIDTDFPTEASRLRVAATRLRRLDELEAKNKELIADWAKIGRHMLGRGVQPVGRVEDSAVEYMQMLEAKMERVGGIIGETLSISSTGEPDPYGDGYDTGKRELAQQIRDVLEEKL